MGNTCRHGSTGRLEYISEFQSKDQYLRLIAVSVEGLFTALKVSNKSVDH